MEIEKRKSYLRSILSEETLHINLKKSLFFLLLLLVVMVALFPIQIILKSVQWKISRYCQDVLGASLDFEEISWEGGKIVMKDGNLEKSDSFQATFQQIVFDPTFNWKHKEIEGELRIEGLKIAYRDIILQNFPSPSFPFIKFNFSTTIEEGELFLYNPSDKTPFSQHVCFDFKSSHINSQTCGEIEWAFPFDCTTHFCKEEDKRWNFDFQFHSPVFLNLLGSLFQEKLPPVMREWRFLEGTLNGDLALHVFDSQPITVKGDLSATEIKGENPHLKLLGEVDHFQADIDIDFNSLASMNGEIEIRGIFMGIEGELALDWQASHKSMHLHFDGTSEKMHRFFPEWMQQALEEGFSDDQLVLEATLKKSKQGLELAGELQISDCEENYNLEFGCFVGEGEVPLPNSNNPFLDHLKSHFCLSQKPFGWFRAKQLPIEKFLSPFLLHNVQIDTFGKANFEGTFDGRYAVIYYEEESFQLESPSFSLSANQPHEQIAVHYVDLETGSHEGFLSLKGARYWQKKQDVVFEKGDALVHFDNGKIHIQDIETSWGSLFLSGEIEIDIRARDDVDLALKVHHVSGSVHDAQTLLSHFTHSFFWELPIEEGQVRGTANALDFQYHFTPQAELIKGEIVGAITCSLHNPFFTLEAFQSDIHYSYSQNKLSLQNGEGALFIPLQKKYYTLKSDPIIFTEFPFFQTHFAVEIYDETNCLYAFEGKTQNQLDTRHILLKGENVALNAIQCGQELTLSQFTFGKWRGEASLEWKKEPLSIRRFYCTDGDQTEIELTAHYQPQNHLLEGTIERIHLFSPWQTKGEIISSATFEWDMSSDHLQARGNASIQDFEFRGIHFSDSEKITCSYSADEGFIVEGLEVELSPDEKLKPGRIHYDISNQTVHFDPFDFSLQPSLSWPFFPYELPQAVIGWVLQQKEPIDGQLSLDASPDNLWFTLRLKDGTYHFFDRTVDLRNFLLAYDPSECNIWTQCLYRENFYWLHFITDSSKRTKGKIALSERELSPEHREGNDSLIASWEKQSNERWSINQLKGIFCGLHASLKATDPFILKGEIGFYPEKGVGPLFDKLNAYSLSGCYTLDGEFRFNEEDLSQVTFSGIFSGSDLSVGGVKLSTFSTELLYQPDSLIFSNFSVKDWAGQMTIDSGKLYRIDETWKIEVDQLQLDKVRLSRLRSPWTQFTPRDKPLLRTFFVRSLILEHLSGIWGDLSSFEGTGKLAFGNLPKKTLLSNLLFLPTEITARIGLDLSVLFPSWGTVFYDIQGSRINFTDFEEVYSDGKHSQFYLVKETPAFVDFNGNISMQVRMKQYNLLLKLVELFTVTVEGTLLRPTYTFSNKFEEDDIASR